MLVRTLNALPLSTVPAPVRDQFATLALTVSGRAQMSRFVARVQDLAPSDDADELAMLFSEAFEEHSAQQAFDVGKRVRRYLGQRIDAGLIPQEIKARYEFDRDTDLRNARIEELCRRLLEAVA